MLKTVRFCLLVGAACGAWSSLAAVRAWFPFGPVIVSGIPNPFARPFAKVAPSDWIELRRSGCLGPCPASSVRIRGDGRVEWHGSYYVQARGDGSGQVDPAAARELIRDFRSRGFWWLWSHYRRWITDNATYCTTVSIAGHVKTVSDYADSAPQWLRDMDKKIDALADTHRWRHGDPGNERFSGNISSERLPRPGFMVGGIWSELFLPKPGVTELMRAVADRGASPTAIHQMIVSGQNVNAADASGWTVLMYGAALGSPETVKRLLAAGARADSRSKAGETVMDALDSEYNRVSRAEKVAMLKAALHQ